MVGCYMPLLFDLYNLAVKKHNESKNAFGVVAKSPRKTVKKETNSCTNYHNGLS
jgi:hypothetical protein